MIELSAIRKTFNEGRPNEHTALRGISLTLDEGRAVVLKGPSGSGKTTLLAVIGCMMRPTEGRITLHGREITSLPERFLTGIRRSSFGFIFQQFNLIKGLTALENAILPSYPTGEAYSDIVRRARVLFDRYGLSARIDARVEWLSGGEAQRVAIIRALINSPQVLIADEPTASLDSKLSAEFMGHFRELKREGKTLIISSHDPLVYESDVIDRVIEIRDGMLAHDA